jgi:hypothetical protein
MRHVVILAMLVAIGAGAAVDFEKQIRPILKEKCYRCHGENKRRGGLRLSNRVDAFMPSDSGEAVIKPGNAAASLMLKRILAESEDERMPPKGDPLNDEQVATIRQWITEGAQWPDDGSALHWAYVKPQKAAVPAGKQPVDHFIGKRLADKGLGFSTQESPARLVRRVSLDLTGLPPSLELVKRFEADPSEANYEKVVDELLASPRFGEHWAQQWLDLARYADSNGYQADQLRDSWAYRDWVIDAYNANMPFDQFTIEQIAGDLMPKATTAQRIATGFHRTVTCNVEAGVDPEENRVNQVFDRVNTTATVWLGATFECAQCHTHKYDPFTINDYYKMFAYFNNTPLEVKQHSGVRYDFVGPKMSLPLSPEAAAKHEVVSKEVAELKEKLTTATKAAAARQAEWETSLREGSSGGVKTTPLEIVSFKSEGGAEHKMLEDGSVLLSGPNPDTDVYVVTAKTTLAKVTGLKIHALTHESLPAGKGPGRQYHRDRGNFLITDLSASALVGGEARPLSFVSAKASYANPQFPVTNAFDDDKESGWSIHNEIHKPHHAIFQFDRSVGDGSEILLTLRIEQNYGQQRQIGRLKLHAAQGSFDLPRVTKSITAIAKKPTNKRTKKERQELAKWFQDADPELKKVRAQLDAKKKILAAIEPASTLVMVEMSEARETFILKRGEFLNKGKKVEPGVPAILHDLPKGALPNRLTLAKWLVDKENPLVGRVTVNRWWHQVMGRGFVPSLEDLGTQSDPPTHPELLDWLAVEFMDSGWDMKHVLRLMVTSKAYKQSAAVTPELLEKDPQNLWFARGPRFRMSAEMIRDNALAISGLLSVKPTGKPVMPPQPDRTWRTTGRNAPVWKVATNEDRFRRAVYVVWRRSAPYVSFVNFDAPDRAACTVSRARTNTPLQALTMLNDPAFVEMGLALAKRMVTEAEVDPDARLEHGFRLCLSRSPNDKEMSLMRDTLSKARAYYKSRPEAATALLKAYPLIKMPKGLSPQEAAAWFYVANVLMNLDETITKG